jgi:hypothetical protein
MYIILYIYYIITFLISYYIIDSRRTWGMAPETYSVCNTLHISYHIFLFYDIILYCTMNLKRTLGKASATYSTYKTYILDHYANLYYIILYCIILYCRLSTDLGHGLRDVLHGLLAVEGVGRRAEAGVDLRVIYIYTYIY